MITDAMVEAAAREWARLAWLQMSCFTRNNVPVGRWVDETWPEFASNCRAALEAALAAAWQPIETAPKDARLLLDIVPAAGQTPIIGFWHDPYGAANYAGYWTDGRAALIPRHWAPLLPAPEKADG